MTTVPIIILLIRLTPNVTATVVRAEVVRVTERLNTITASGKCYPNYCVDF